MLRFHLTKAPFVEEIQHFEVTWEGETLPIEETLRRIQNGYYPQTLVIYHPEYGTVHYNLFNDSIYDIARSGPPLTGIRGGLARTFANRSIDRQYLIEHIDDIFGNVSQKLNTLQRGKQKLLRLQTEAARKLIRNSGQEVPRNVEQGILEMIGEKKPVTGAFNVPNSQARIQTNLFTNEVVMPRHLKKINTTLFNGGKRRAKSRRMRRTRRQRR